MSAGTKHSAEITPRANDAAEAVGGPSSAYRKLRG